MAVELLTRPALEAQPVGYFAPTYKLLLELWRWLESTLRPVVKRSNATDRRIELITGGVIECWTLEDDDAGRSRKYARVVVDEAGLVPKLGDIWQAAIRPTLADLRGDAWMLGTPKGRNFFYECYERGRSLADWMSWQKPTSDNPYIAPDEIAAMRLEMTERRFAQEVLAEFLDDAGGVFRNVRAVATEEKAEPRDGAQYVYGIDWGRLVDYTAISVWDATRRREVAFDRFNTIEYAQQEGRLQALVERYPPQVIIAEQNSIGLPIIERLLRLDLPVQPFVTTNATKAQVVDGLALAFEQQSVKLLNDPIGIAELEAFEATRLPSGLTRYSAPEGLHDDTVMARCLAYYGVCVRGPVEVRRSAPVANRWKGF